MIEQVSALYDKKFKCPYCENSFASKRVRSGSLSMTKRDRCFRCLRMLFRLFFTSLPAALRLVHQYSGGNGRIERFRPAI